jgi:hypothetical protein
VLALSSNNSTERKKKKKANEKQKIPNQGKLKMFKITKSQVRLLQNLQTLPTLIHETVTREIFNQESISEFRR